MEHATIKFKGREIGLFYSIGATIELAKLAGGSIENLTDLLNGNTVEMLSNLVKIILILNKWYCVTAKDTPITENDLMVWMDVNDISEYVEAIQKAISVGSKAEIETKEIKQKNVKSTTPRK